MPLSELYKAVNGKKESRQQKANDISYIPNDEFMELVWEKGQIMMQGQSSKARKTPVSNNFQFHTSKVEEKEGVEMGLNQDDDMVPWFVDYGSELLPGEVSGVSVNEPTTHNCLSLIDKDSHSLTHNVSLHHGEIPNRPVTVRSGVSDIGSSNASTKPHNGIHRDSIQSQGSLVHKQDSLLPYSSSSLLNFSHFSKLAAMARANLQNNEHHAALNVVSLDSGKVVSNNFMSKPLEEVHCVEKTYTNRREDATSNDDMSLSVVLDACAPKGGPDTETNGASSSCVWSGNGAERASNDLTKKLKRKSPDMEDFECQCEDIEQESLGTKAAATSRGGTCSKRSRAAQVHNLSERRRRDRINEKMRALQQLIPNCNKVDKASMLDEAIEYLKSLQLQVQMMSMGSGPLPMMFPTGMHLFSPMGFPPITGLDSFKGIPRSTLESYGHPMLFSPQPLMPWFSTNPSSMQNNNSHVMTQTQTPSLCQAANKSLDRSSFVDKKDQVPEATCSTLFYN